MVSAESAGSWAAALREDWGIEHLVQALLLGEGFGFHILSCSTPRTAQAAFLYLEQAAGRRLRILRPPSQQDAGQPITPKELFTSVLEPLIAPLDPALGPWMLAIDASGVREEEEPAWREVFRRMNERRNGLVRHIEVPLLLCVSPRMEIAFAQEAPDFWSIRTTRVDVPPLPVEALPDEPPPAEESIFRRPSFAFEAERVRQEIAQVRQRVKEKPDDTGALATLSIWLQRLGRLTAERSDLQSAAAAFDEALRIRSTLAGRHPENLQMQAAHADSLMDGAEVEFSRGYLERARALTEEALGVLRRLLSRDPSNPEWRAGMARSYQQIGMVTQKRGAYDEAREWYKRSLQVKEKLDNRAGRAGTISQLGVLATVQGRPEEGLLLNLQSLAIRRELQVPEMRIDLLWLRRQRVLLGEERFGELLREHVGSSRAETVLGLMAQVELEDGAAT